MNTLKQILRYPIKRTLVITAIVFFVYIIFFLASFYLNRISNAYIPQGMYPDNPTLLFGLAHRLVDDFYLITRLALEILAVTLIAQFIYRITRK